MPRSELNQVIMFLNITARELRLLAAVMSGTSELTRDDRTQISDKLKRIANDLEV